MSYWLAWPFVAFRGSARLAQLAVLVAAALALLSTCILPPEPSSQEVLIEFEVPADTVRLAVGGEVRPTVTVRADGNVLASVRLQFASADPTVVAVDSTGSLRAIRRGVTSVRIVLLSGSAGVSPPDTTFPVRVIVLGMRVASAVETLTALGDTLPFRPGYLNASGQALAAADSAAITPLFALVSSGQAVTLNAPTGEVVAKANGTDTVRASVDTARVDLVVTVRQLATRVAVSPEAVQFRSFNETRQLADSAWDRRGAFISQRTTVWTSTNPQVVTVSSTGLATSVSNGSAAITATVDGVAGGAAISVTQVPKQLMIASGDGQRGRVGTNLSNPFTIQVADSVGSAAAVPGVLVTFQVTEGGGKIAGKDTAIVATDAAGRASATLTLGSVAGAVNRVTATAATLSGTAFTAVGTGDAHSIAAISGDGQRSLIGTTLPAPFVVKVLDNLGNAVNGVGVTFKVVAGGGKLGGQDSVVTATDNSGLASAALTLGSGVGDTNRVNATSAGLVGSPVTFKAVGLGPVASVTLSPESLSVGVGGAGRFEVTLKDAAGSVLTDPSVTWSTSNAGIATVDQTGLVTGVALGSATIIATSEGVSGTAKVIVSTPAATVTVAPLGATISAAGGTKAFTAEARDASGNLLTGRTFTWASLNPNVVTIEPSTGVATAVTSGQVTISATTDGRVGYALLTVAIPGATAVASWSTGASGTITLFGIWGTSASGIYAVGGGGTILRYNGASWSAMTSGTGNSLWGVWGTAGSDIYAVGLSGTILRYNGTSWNAMNSGTTNPLWGVWGTSGSDIYAVGMGGTIVHYNGASWSATASGTTNELRAAWGTSRSDIYAVGMGGTIVHYNGTSWSAMTSRTTQTLFGIWGTSGSEIYAVGSNGTILRYNGTSWSAMTSGTTDELRTVWGTSGSDIYTADLLGQVRRHDGTTWSSSGGSSAPLYAVWGTSGSDVYAVGSDGTILQGVRGAATVASVVVSPAGATISAPSGTQAFSADARDATGNVIPGKTFTWASLNPNVATTDASTGVATAVSSGQVTVSATVDGKVGHALVTVAISGATPVTTWSAVSGTSFSLDDIWGLAANDIFTVAGDGTILRFDGSTWNVVKPNADPQGGVWGSSSNNIFAVSSFSRITGTGILRFDGTSWQAMSNSTTPAFYDVWGTAPNNVFAVGGGIARFDGTGWSTSGSPGGNFYGAWASSSVDVWAVGEEGGPQTGKIFRFNGTNWSQVTTTGVGQQLYGIWGFSPSDIFAVGNGGTILRYNGTTWSPMSSGTTAALNAVWGSSPSDVYAVGGAGTVLRFDGGVAPLSRTVRSLGIQAASDIARS